MLISVVLPVYNGLPLLNESISSILAQDIKFELIISDDSSTDETKTMLRRLSDPRIRVLLNDANLGIFGNLNRCIGIARGEFIQVFSQDDLMKSGYLASQVRMLQKYPDAGLVYGTPAKIDENGSPIVTARDPTPEFINPRLYLWIASHYNAVPPSISSIMLPRRTFETVGLFDPGFRVAGDIEFYNRVSEQYPIVRNLEVLHAIRSHQRMTSRTARPLYLREELVLEEWYRSRWNVREYRKIKWFRCMTRGKLHISWISRKMLDGKILEALVAFRQLNKIYRLDWLLWCCIMRLLHPRWRPRPSLPAPDPFNSIFT